MSLLDTILSSNGGAVSQIAKQVGLPEPLAKQAVSALTPALASGLQHNAAQPGGLDALLKALGSGKHEQYVDEPEKLGQQASVDDGNAILGHILGSKEVSRNVAGAASEKTGVDSSILKKMLPMLAGVVMGSLSKQTNAGSQLTALTGSASTGDPLSMLSGLLGSDNDTSSKGLLNLAKKLL